MHPVAERHQRLQALIKYTRSVMKRTQVEMYLREEMIENYIRLHWALGDTAIRDYKKTALLIVQEEIEKRIESVNKEIPNAPAREEYSLIELLENR